MIARIVQHGGVHITNRRWKGSGNVTMGSSVRAGSGPIGAQPNVTNTRTKAEPNGGVDKNQQALLIYPMSSRGLRQGFEATEKKEKKRKLKKKKGTWVKQSAGFRHVTPGRTRSSFHAPADSASAARQMFTVTGRARGAHGSFYHRKPDLSGSPSCQNGRSANAGGRAAPMLAGLAWLPGLRNDRLPANRATAKKEKIKILRGPTVLWSFGRCRGGADERAIGGLSTPPWPESGEASWWPERIDKTGGRAISKWAS